MAYRESDKEALGDGFLDDLHTALTPIEQIANGDYFVNWFTQALRH